MFSGIITFQMAKSHNLVFYKTEWRKYLMKNAKEKSPIAVSTILFYVAAVIVLLIGAAYLVVNVRYYNSMVAGYVAQGYDAAEVAAQLIPQKLLPGIFEPVGIFGGIAAILCGISLINKKLSELLTFGEEICCCDEEEADEEAAPAEESTETAVHVETAVEDVATEDNK